MRAPCPLGADETDYSRQFDTEGTNWERAQGLRKYAVKVDTHDAVRVVGDDIAVAAHPVSNYHSAQHSNHATEMMSLENSMKMVLAALTLGALLSGCAVTKNWSATGGSRADGVVRLSYEVGEMETAQLNETQAVNLAAQRCKTWGYAGAEAFGGVTRQCNRMGGLSGCAQWMVTKEFQCTGTGTEATATRRTAYPLPPSGRENDATSLPQGRQDNWATTSFTAAASSAGSDQQEAESARIVLTNTGCQTTKAPVRFKQQHDTNFYEARCTDGRLVHALCTFGDCRLRTRED